MKRISTGLLFTTLLLAGCGDGSGPTISSTPARLTQYQSCTALENDLRQMAVNEINARYEQIKDGGYYGPGGVLEGDDTQAPGAENSGDGRQEGVDYSGTNNQEEGVDEADFVKTDGYHVYVLNGNQLHIFGTPEFGDLDFLSASEIEGFPQQMLIDDTTDRLVVFSMIYPWTLPEQHPLHAIIGEAFDEYSWMWRVDGLSKLTVFDISDRSEPVLERELFVEGFYQTARLANGSVRVGSYAHLAIRGLYGWDWRYYDSEGGLEDARDAAIATVKNVELEEMVPRIHERLPDGALTTHALTGSACADFYRPGDSNGRGFTSIVSLNLFDESLDYDADHVVSNWGQIYASQEGLYIAEQSNDWWWFWWNRDRDFETNIHKFDISTPGQAFYNGSGRVPGVINNQFSMSEYENTFRIATTTNPWNGEGWTWTDEEGEEIVMEPAANNVFVLAQKGDGLEVIGHVGDIAPGERIFASRFMGEKGYLVTFRQTDPLFTIDLSNPEKPKVVGELEIPGFSNYLHPLGDEHLLGIGVGGDENGANWVTQISLFDVGDFSDPQLQQALPLSMEDGWSWSEARWDHKAFQYWGPEKLLAVPISSYSYSGNNYSYLSTLELVSADTDGLASYGTIDHSDFFNSDPDYYWDYRDVRRSIFMGDFIYAISDRGITVHNLDGLSTVNTANLPGYTGEYYWWW